MIAVYAFDVDEALLPDHQARPERTRMNAEELARALAARFLEEGNYEALEVPLGQQGGEALTSVRKLLQQARDK